MAIIGYGKMGKSIEKIALSRGHEIVAKIDKEEISKLPPANQIDIAIEFTQPDSAFDNISYCLENGIPVISGTTGWLESYQEIVSLCHRKNGVFLHASNFSISVNLFFALNTWLAKTMRHVDYEVDIEEIHHTEKKDAPSGTALTLAEGILNNHSAYKSWTNQKKTDKTQIPIVSKRESNFPGTHSVTYSTPLESISIQHIANDRSIFAEGAVLVAEWITDKKGVFTISDFIQI